MVVAEFKGSRMSLVLGSQSPEIDQLYREEVMEMKKRGVLNNVHWAFSRQPGQPKVGQTRGPETHAENTEGKAPVAL